MRDRWAWFLGVLLAGALFCAPAMADAEAPVGDAPLTVCFNWSCKGQARLSLADADWQAAAAYLAAAQGPADERIRLAAAVGGLYAALSRQAPIAADRAGNTLDAGVDGRMDCIDHAVTTSQLLRGLEARGSLRYHRVVAVQRRTSYWVVQHLAAAVEVRSGPLVAAADREGESFGGLGSMTPAVFVVDSWFADPGTPAVVLPLAAWTDGEGPDVE